MTWACTGAAWAFTVSAPNAAPTTVCAWPLGAAPPSLRLPQRHRAGSGSPPPGIGIRWLLSVVIHSGRIGAWLDEHDVDARLREFVAKAVVERFDPELAGPVDPEERVRYAADTRVLFDPAR